MAGCMKRLLALFSFAWLSSAAQAPQTTTSAEIFLGLKKLNVLGSVLYVAAHPDDENTRLLTWLSKDRMYRTGYLSLTRGDGGQNLIGDEQGIALGLIRTQELLAARRIDGAEQFFSRAFDFGFSKNPEETFTKWDHDAILSDVVWTIRKFRPDVIITRFPTTGEGGHGHHTASAILANEAFKAAADPKRFPEQLKWVEPWQARRILWNTFNFGGNNTQREDQFKIDVGGFNPVLGKSYGEIAAESRSQHKSQGFGVPRSRGSALEYFATTGGAAPLNDLMEDVPLTWKRVPGAEKIEAAIAAIVRGFDFVHPEAIVPQLTTLYDEMAGLAPSYWRNKKMEEVQQLIAACSGLWFEATTNLQKAVQADSLRIQFSVINRSKSDLMLYDVKAGGFDTLLKTALQPNQQVTFAKTIFVPADKPISQPYWLLQPMEKGMFTVSDQNLIGQPDLIPAFTARVHVYVNHTGFTFEKPVQYKFTDPVKGEIYQPVYVVPPATLVATPDLLIFSKSEPAKKEVAVRLYAHKAINTTQAEVSLRSDAVLLRKTDTALVLGKGTAKNYSFPVSNTKLKAQEVLQVSAQYKNSPKSLVADLTLVGIDYDHIPSIRYFYRDEIKALNIDLKTVGRKIGYITGAGDKVAEALEQMGYEVVLLGEKELQRNNLQQFDAIVTGVRAYNTNEWLNGQYEKLMQYVQEGGNLIVQYNTASQVGPLKAKIGPYDFDISRNRVTNEEAPVNFLLPQHPVLNFPNKITVDDFKGWIQERSIYHATATDPAFEKVLDMSDPGESSDNGSLVIAKYGKGFFTYTGLVFFRELPAGVPGAYRLMANLIALNHKKAF